MVGKPGIGESRFLAELKSLRGPPVDLAFARGVWCRRKTFQQVRETMSLRSALLRAFGLSLIVLVAAGCQGNLPAATPADKGTETYAVYSAVIADVGGLPVVSDRAGGRSWKDSDYDRVHAQFSEMDRFIWDDLNAANDHAEQLQNRFDSDLGQVTLANWADLGILFSKNKPEAAWEIFHEKYPDKCLLGLSSVGFSERVDEALVYASRSCDAGSGGGNIVYLAKERGKWTVKGKVTLWGLM